MNLEKMYAPSGGKEVKKEILEGELEYRDGEGDLEEDGEMQDERENYIEHLRKIEEEKGVPEELIDSEDFVENSSEERLDAIYDNYHKSISRKNREPLSREGFKTHFFEGGGGKTYLFGDDEKGYLLGVYDEGIFIPTHSAPKSIRKAYELMKELGGSTMPSVVFVTEDIAEMLNRISEWQVTDIKVDANFRGKTVEKTIAHNNIPDFERKLDIYYSMKEEREEEDYDELDWGDEEEDYYDYDE